MEARMNKVIDAILQRSLILSYDIVMDSSNRISVRIQQHGPEVPEEEFCRLWVDYHVKVLEKLGYPGNVDGVLASVIIGKIVAKPFTSETDCFARAELSGVVKYTEDPIVGSLTMTGRYYKKGQKRSLVTDLPGDITAKHLIYASVGLLQFCLNRCGQDGSEGALIFQMAKSMLFLLSSDSGYDTSDSTSLPDAAYSLAKRTWNREEDGIGINLQ